MYQESNFLSQHIISSNLTFVYRKRLRGQFSYKIRLVRPIVHSFNVLKREQLLENNSRPFASIGNDFKWAQSNFMLMTIYLNYLPKSHINDFQFFEFFEDNYGCIIAL